MKLDYGTQLSPAPLELSVGTVRKPTLREISEITFGKFNFYEVLMDLTPKVYYEKILGGVEDVPWITMTEDERENAEIYDVLVRDEELQRLYEEMFNFFIEEEVVYAKGVFFVMKTGCTLKPPLKAEDLRGVIQKGNFKQVLGVLRQICCLGGDEEPDKPPKFKNKKAREIYEKIQKGKQKRKEIKKHDVNLSIPNIISAVANKHLSLNLVNIWDLTIFQLLDSFNRLQSNAMYDIDSMRVSTWGDEKKTFDVSLWYKNYFEKNDQSK